MTSIQLDNDTRPILWHAIASTLTFNIADDYLYGDERAVSEIEKRLGCSRPVAKRLYKRVNDELESSPGRNSQYRSLALEYQVAREDAALQDWPGD